MPPEIAAWVVLISSAYALAGVGFAVGFAAVGIGRIDSKARDSGWRFRLLTIPGAAALWPLLAYRWLSAKEAR